VKHKEVSHGHIPEGIFGPDRQEARAAITQAARDPGNKTDQGICCRTRKGFEQETPVWPEKANRSKGRLKIVVAEERGAAALPATAGPSNRPAG